MRDICNHKQRLLPSTTRRTLQRTHTLKRRANPLMRPASGERKGKPAGGEREKPKEPKQTQGQNSGGREEGEQIHISLQNHSHITHMVRSICQSRICRNADIFQSRCGRNADIFQSRTCLSADLCLCNVHGLRPRHLKMDLCR